MLLNIWSKSIRDSPASRNSTLILFVVISSSKELCGKNSLQLRGYISILLTILVYKDSIVLRLGNSLF